MGQQTHGTLTVYEDGTRIDLFCPYTPQASRGGGKRSEVQGFSFASRVRLMKLLSSLRTESIAKAKLITLTYHEKYNDIKRDLKHFKQWLRRTDPDCSGIWRLEFQERGMPHYHLLHFGRFIPSSEIAGAWNRIAEPTSRDHLKAGTEIRSVKHVNLLGAYLAKYMGKVDQAEGPETGTDSRFRWGRFWGVYNRNALPISKTKTIVIPWEYAAERIEKELSAFTDFHAAKGNFTKLTGRPDDTKAYVEELLNELRTK